MTIEELKNQYDVSNYIETKIPIPNKPDTGLVFIKGSSGSGKTTILRAWGHNKSIEFDNTKTVIENFSSPEAGDKLLRAFGLRSIPTWFRPASTLSNGEYHRALCALCVDSGVVFIDEFTSTVDRNTAKSLAVSLRKFTKNRLLVVASCHDDIEEWLCPDTVYDADKQEWENRRYLRRPSIRIDIVPSTVKDWVYFKKHHYLSDDVSRSCHFYTAYIGNRPVAFLAIIHRTCRDIRSYWGESRLVVIPEFQGLGIGIALSEAIADEYKKRGLRYFAKTSHPSLGEYRNSSSKWRATSTNMVKRTSYLKDGKARLQRGFGKTEESIYRDAKRICYSHEYIGSPTTAST